jgi:hypothetical protein
VIGTLTSDCDRYDNQQQPQAFDPAQPIPLCKETKRQEPFLRRSVAPMVAEPVARTFIVRRYPSDRRTDMADLSEIKEHMEIIGADGVHVGTVDKVEGDRIKMTKADSGSHSDHHHYLSGGLVAAVEGNQVRLSAAGNAAVLLEEEDGGEPLSDKRS